MIRRCLALAVTTTLFPVVSQATNLLQVYEMARAADPQLSAAESTRLYSVEGQVQASRSAAAADERHSHPGT